MSFAACLLALTLTIYTEAGGEGDKGMELVADVIATRVTDERYPDTACKVVLQKSQFDWTKRLKHKDFNGLLTMQKKVFKTRPQTSQEKAAYAQAMFLASKVMKPGYKPKYHYTHFYSGTDRPYWAKGKKAFKYRNHYFLKLHKPKGKSNE